MGNAPTLVLRYSDGRTENFQLAYEKKKLYLGGDRYYWSKADCGG